MARRPDEGTHDARLAGGEIVSRRLSRGSSLCPITLCDCVVPVMDRPIEVMQLIDFFLLSQRSSEAAARIHSNRSIWHAFYWKRGSMLDCRCRGRRNSSTWEGVRL